jgi:hypothetical protein
MPSAILIQACWVKPPGSWFALNITSTRASVFSGVGSVSAASLAAATIARLRSRISRPLSSLVCTSRRRRGSRYFSGFEIMGTPIHGGECRAAIVYGLRRPTSDLDHRSGREFAILAAFQSTSPAPDPELLTRMRCARVAGGERLTIEALLDPAARRSAP